MFSTALHAEANIEECHMQQLIEAPDASAPRAGGWSAVFALTLCTATLIASEFMPVSLLTPIATDLHLTAGQAGQAISVSGIFAVLTSLSLSALTASLDRRTLLLGLTGAMIASGLIVAFAPSFALLIVGRALLGIVIGGFWSMSAATVMRLVPEADVPRALALLNGGTALATTIGAPLGSYLGQYIGWRGAFVSVVPLAAIALAWLIATLPAMPSRVRADFAAPFKVLRLPLIAYGMAAVALFFMGRFALFTYLRPFLETVTGVDVSTLSLLLLVLGISGLIGTMPIGRAVRANLYGTLIAIPSAMALVTIGLIALGGSTIMTAILLAAWGLLGTAAPVAWWTWLSKSLPDDAEAGGGLMVAVIQLAITLGAGGGGLMFDASGYRATFAASAAILCASAVLALLAGRAARAPLWRPTEKGEDALSPCASMAA
jgi:predicted MFS family arabinose efflux permease